MTKQKQTLFEKLNIQDAFRSVESNSYLRKSGVIRFFILAITLAIVTIFFTFHLENDFFKGSGQSLAEGQVWHGKTVIAKHSFPVYKSRSKYNSEVSNAREKVLPVFVVKGDILDKTNTQIGNILDTSNIKKNINFDKEDYDEYKSNFNRNNKAVIDFITKVYKNGFIDLNKSDVNTNNIRIVNNKNEQTILKLNSVYDLPEIKENITKLLQNRYKEYISEYIFEQTSQVLTPNLVFSERLTEKRRSLAEQNVAKTEEVIEAGEVITKKGDRLNEKQVRIIKSYFNSIDSREERGDPYLLYLGSFGHALLILSLLVVYLYNIRKRIFNDNFQLLILCSLFVITAILAWLSIEIDTSFNIEFLIFVPAFAMVTAIIFDSRTAFYFTVTLALLIAGVRGNDYSAAMMHLFAGAMAAYTVKDIQSRTQMFKSIFFIFLAFLLPLLVFFLERSNNIMEFVDNLILISANSVLSPLISYGIIFSLERFPNFSTDLKLKEYDNLDHPLLKKMSEIAPGTYQHSLNLAMLAERCAIAIGANPIFCRVSCLYHDIGKMKKPEYFVENQIDIGNKHEKLSPKKSAKIIIEHVTYGVELAHKYNLPSRMIDIIYMHHGTTLVQHFYNQALTDAQDSDEEVKEEDFRYPGPRPNSKEAALVMICDTAEAISHIKNFTSEELDTIIQKVIDDRILDGQFEQCNITLQELQIIKFTVVKNLIGMGHKRVQYKEAPKTIKTDYDV